MTDIEKGKTSIGTTVKIVIFVGGLYSLYYGLRLQHQELAIKFDKFVEKYEEHRQTFLADITEVKSNISGHNNDIRSLNDRFTYMIRPEEPSLISKRRSR